ncbi:glycoside hydrolase family 3 C-terminal domain-containing protein [candidate division KSB1 bacterium]|nr:glycoside hydrolase family 3 C-terminal domain-containing protein [candidate division KSB1 bacterium]
MATIIGTLLLAVVVSLAATDCGNRNLVSPVIEHKIDSLLHELTLEEKIALLHANAKFSSAGVARLGIPELKYTDGPYGIREEMKRHSWQPARITTDSATYFPTGTALAATWNPELAYLYGAALGSEARARRKDVLLGPAINLIRMPLNGRNFEFLSEDPYLNARLSVAYINGVQCQDVAACVKHFVLNNQERHRSEINVTLDERALRELYLPPFKAAVIEGHVYTVMTAYNKFQNAWCSENIFLLNEILKKEWGFQGFVVSDWAGTHSTYEAALAGLDVEMGTEREYDSNYFARPLLAAVETGRIDPAIIDDKARRVLRVMFACKTTDTDKRSYGARNTPGHSKTVYDVAAESIVLLKNTGGLLPLRAEHVQKIAVIGDNAVRKHASGGFGAGVKAKYEITPLAALKQKLGDIVHIEFTQGYRKQSAIHFRQGIQRETNDNPDIFLINKAAEVAASVDVALVFVGLNHDYDTEALDRENLILPYEQDRLVKTVAAANPKTVVIIIAGSPVDVNEINRSAPAVIWGWLNGSEAGKAITDVLFGDINPSGKMPFTLPVDLEHSPAHALDTYPGQHMCVEYKEGILVGYRWYETKKIEPAYCFGYGLSYTSFHYLNCETDKQLYHIGDTIQVKIQLQNTGDLTGAETVQLYVHKPESSVLRPAKELKAFQKIMLQPGETNAVTLWLSASDLAFWDVTTNNWKLEPGEYKLMLGSSSMDIRFSKDIIIE